MQDEEKEAGGNAKLVADEALMQRFYPPPFVEDLVRLHAAAYEEMGKAMVKPLADDVREAMRMHGLDPDDPVFHQDPMLRGDPRIVRFKYTTTWTDGHGYFGVLRQRLALFLAPWLRP